MVINVLLKLSPFFTFLQKSYCSFPQWRIKKEVHRARLGPASVSRGASRVKSENLFSPIFEKNEIMPTIFKKIWDLSREKLFELGPHFVLIRSCSSF